MAARGGNPVVNLMIEPLAKSMTDPKTDSMTNPMVDDTLFLGVEHMRQTHLTRWNHHYQLASHFGNCSKKELIISYNCIGLPCKAEMIKIMTLIFILQTNSVTTTITQGQ